jgi:trehalose 6-phosphate phosphatase
MLVGTPLVIMLDIDGTLCDIVERAADARVPGGARAVLRALGNRTSDRTHLAFVTGRSAADARRMLGIDGAVIYGNHGMERPSAPGHLHTPGAQRGDGAGLRAAVPDFADLVTAFPGTMLEDKGLSLTLHYRAMDSAQLPALDARVAAIAAQHGLRVSPGKCVLNVLPATGFTKGDAVLEVVRLSGADSAGASVLFAGDDVTDEDAFRALRRVPGAVTIRVGSKPADSAARYSLDGPRDVHALLALIAETAT